MVETTKGRGKKGQDSLQRTLVVALVLSLTASLLVTVVATQLRPLQERNEIENRQRNILAVAGIDTEGLTLEEAFEAIDTRVVELASGEYAEDVEPTTFEARDAKNDPERSVPISPDADIANLKRRATHGKVYLVREAGEVRRIIFPVYGAGLWSTMYGFISLDTDGNTVAGLQFYEHAETPGLGDKVEDPAWLGLWEGKLVYGPDSDTPLLEVIRGQVPRDLVSSTPPQRGDPIFQVDGMAGATLTGRGVANLIQYWLGPDAYGPYIQKHWREREA